MLVVSDITLDGSGTVAGPSPMDRMLGREGELVLVNGQSNPKLSARPGERERWRIVNTCVARYLQLRLDGQQLQLLGIDSGRFPTPRNADEVLLAPGNRADVLVTAVDRRRHSQCRLLQPWQHGRHDGTGRASPNSAQGTGDLVLATLSVTGATGRSSCRRCPSRTAAADLRTAAVAARRQLTFAVGGMGMGMGRHEWFTINGREFNASRTDTTVAAQTVEEWTLINPSPMDHPFHLHVWPMQIIEERARRRASPSGVTSSTYPPTDRCGSGSTSRISPAAPCTTATSWTTRTKE